MLHTLYTISDILASYSSFSALLFYFTAYIVFFKNGSNVRLSYAAIFDYDYVFSENGLVAHKDGKVIGNTVIDLFHGKSLIKTLGF